MINFFRQSYRKIVAKLFPKYEISYSEADTSDLIQKGLNSNRPFLCARLGCTELQTIAFVRMSQIPIIGWTLKPFWKGVCYSIWNSSGVFNPTPPILIDFANLYENFFPEIDILASWHQSERFFDSFFSKKKKISYAYFQPNLIKSSWTSSLKGKKVLVIHPFADSIKSQYERRLELFDDPNILPEFGRLYTLKAVQSVAGNIPTDFQTWFDALEYMRGEMVKIDYEVALIGCGAYGFPLAAWAKQNGKKALLLGGSLQLLFGIKGRRWVEHGSAELHKIMEKPSWVWPSSDETPSNIERVPGSGYW